MGQAASKLGTGLKSTGGSFRREGVQAYPVLVYTKFLTGPKTGKEAIVSTKFCSHSRVLHLKWSFIKEFSVQCTNK